MTDGPEPGGSGAMPETRAPGEVAVPDEVAVPGEPRAHAAAPQPASSGLGASAFGPLVPLATIVLVMVGALALREVATILVPVVFGLFLALVAWPMVGILRRRGARHGIALTAALMVVLAIVLVAGGILALSVTELVLQVPKYEGRLRDQVEVLQDLLGQLGITTDPAALLALIRPEQILSIVRPVASALSGAGLTIFVLSVTMIYALFGASSLQARARQTFGERHVLILGIERFGVDLRRYLLVRAQLGVFAAVLAFLLLLVLGVPFPALWAFLVFAASFIPNIGTFIAVIPPTIMAFLSGGLVPAIAVVVGYTLINFAQDHFLQPVMMGSELNLSPLVVFLSVLVWAWILGAAGALLAVPLTVGLVAIMEAYPASREVAALLRNTIEPPPGSMPDENVFTAPPD
jgi:predicted PurR-regulated permease PerM